VKRILAIALIVAAIGAAVAVYYIRRGGVDITVNTAPVTEGDIVDAVAATGTLQPVISVTVGSQVSGNIAWLGADFNSVVKKGQVIAKLDPTLFEAAVNSAKGQLGQTTANLENAKAQLAKDQANLAYQKVAYERAKDLRKAELVTQDQLDQSKASVDQATASVELDKASILQAQAAIEQSKAQLNTAQTNLTNTVILSPINGIVTQRSVDVGQTVQASMTAPTLFVIAEDLSQLQVSANIDESDVGRVTPGQDVLFRVDAFPGSEFHGTVGQIRLNPTIVNNVTVYATMINVPNDDLRLKPGMTANLKVQVARKSGVLRVPNAALRFRPALDVFTALNQPVPPEALPRGGRGGAGRGGGSTGNGQAAQSAQVTRGGGDAENRQQLQMERFRAMSPDEQRQFLARLVDRGLDTSAFEAVMESTAGKKAEKNAEKDVEKNGGRSPDKTKHAFVYKPRYGEEQNSETIARLFATSPQTDATGRVWLYVNRQLKPQAIRVGITDGTFTELRGGDLQDGTQVVTGILTGGSSRAQATTGNPFQQQPNRGGGPGRF
jgi:HlyD family secretion protein